MKTNAILLDVGVLLTPEEDDYDEYELYSQVYDRQYGYYDENQIAYKGEDFEKAIKYAREYVANDVDMTYAIITNQGIVNYEEPWDDGNIEGFTYNHENVIFSVAKIHNKIIENFIEEAQKC